MRQLTSDVLLKVDGISQAEQSEGQVAQRIKFATGAAQKVCAFHVHLNILLADNRSSGKSLSTYLQHA